MMPHPFSVPISSTVLAIALSLSAATAAQPSASTPTTTPACPASWLREDPALTALRESMLVPNGAEQLKTAMGNLGARGAQLLKDYRDRTERDWPFLCRYRADNARILSSGPRPQVVFIGDSITENWAYADTSLFGQRAVGRGIGGQYSGQILLRMYQDVVGLKPQVVHLMAGTNDLGQQTNAAFGDDDIVNNIQAMIDIAQKNGIRVIVAGIPPKSPPSQSAWPTQRIRRINAQLSRLASNRGAVYVDYHSVLADSNGAMRSSLTSDGVHPNRPAYQLMRPLAERAIAQALRGQ